MTNNYVNEYYDGKIAHIHVDISNGRLVITHDHISKVIDVAVEHVHLAVYVRTGESLQFAHVCTLNDIPDGFSSEFNGIESLCVTAENDDNARETHYNVMMVHYVE